ncbi:MAG: ABC transporter permease [Actinobacteria bacterium]|nr:MAG: ABC transporter permease [Actinomycetota bacterium]
MASVSPSRSAAVARHELRLIRRDPVYLLTFIFMPLIVMAFIKPVFRYMVAPNISGVNGSEQAVPGVTVMFSMFLVGSVGFGFFREYGWGTWERVRASWASPAEIMVGKTLVPMLQSALQLGVLFGVGGVLLGLHVRGSLIALVLVAAAFCICLISMGHALLAVSRTVMQLNAFANLGGMVLAGVGGSLAPASALPGWARVLAPMTPTYWAMRGFRQVILHHGGPLAGVEPIAVLVAFSVGFVIIATSIPLRGHQDLLRLILRWAKSVMDGRFAEPGAAPGGVHGFGAGGNKAPAGSQGGPWSRETTYV